MVNVLPPFFPGGRGVPFGPDPLLPLLRLLRQDPLGQLPALLAPLSDPPAPPLWSVTVPGLRLPLLISLPRGQAPEPAVAHQRFSGNLFESNNQLFFRPDLSGIPGESVFLLVEDLPAREQVDGSKEEVERDFLSGDPGKVFMGGRDRNGAPSPLESHFLKTGEVPIPSSTKVSGSYPAGMPSPGGAPPVVEFELRLPDSGESGPSSLPRAETSGPVSFRLSVSYANGEKLDLIGVYDPSLRKLNLHPRSSSIPLLAYWEEMGGELRRAFSDHLSILLGGFSPSDL